MPWNWISRQGLFCQGFATGMIGRSCARIAWPRLTRAEYRVSRATFFPFDPSEKKTRIQWLDADNAFTLLTVRFANGVDHGRYRTFRLRKYEIHDHLLSRILLLVDLTGIDGQKGDLTERI